MHWASSTPAPVVMHEEGRGSQYVTWPASRYLARMVKHAPGEVAEIFAGVDTDNPSVVGDMLDAMVEMPAPVAKMLVPALCRAAQAGALWMRTQKAPELCVHLANGGEESAALALADALFTPKLEEDQEGSSRRDEHWYKDGLKKVVPALATRLASQFTPRLCDWLKAIVEVKEHDGLRFGSDYSNMWRPANEEHAQNLEYEFAGVIVGLVRQGFEQAVQHGQLTLIEALEILARYEYLVFRRMRVHLINEFADQKPELARQTMMDRDLFDDYKYKHEYAMLVGRRFLPAHCLRSGRGGLGGSMLDWTCQGSTNLLGNFWGGM